MWLSKKDSMGNKYYVDAFSGEKKRLLKVNPRHQVKLPDYVFKSFRISQPIGTNISARLIK